jgi:AcrR family transcriptional regulator
MDQKEIQIVKQVLELYKKYGIKSVTMDDVSTHMAISKKTLYKYVSDKSDLVNKVVNYDMEKRGVAFKNIFSKPMNAIEELLEVNKLITEFVVNYNCSMEYDLQKYYPEIFMKIKKVKRENMFSAIINNLKKGKKEGLYRKNLNEEIITKLHVFRIENRVESDQFSPDEIASPEFINEVFSYHIRGIVNKTGLELFETSNFELIKK